MIGKIKMMAIITFYVAVLLVIAVYLQDGSGTFSHFFENANLYIRNLRNVHAPAFHQTYDKISGITSKNGRNDAKRLNIRVVTVSNDDKPKNRKTQRKADLRRRMVCKSLPVKE